MSSYIQRIKHNGEEVEAYFIDDYFGRHQYGVKIGDRVYREEDIKYQIAEDKKKGKLLVAKND